MTPEVWQQYDAFARPCCLFCGGPLPCEHSLPAILNASYYCPDGRYHIWSGKKWWYRQRCLLCGYRRPK